ncbi:hypothetical protein [Roseinatronobacter sp. NSM]|uniref:hypothetical protein n=1 Tax=Roseinatronobacter sp. NSM TaxID=3457785 RepID=UPI0040364E8A
MVYKPLIRPQRLRSQGPGTASFVDRLTKRNAKMVAEGICDAQYPLDLYQQLSLVVSAEWDSLPESYKANRLPEEELIEWAIETEEAAWCLARGNNAFVIGPDVTEMLRRTDASDVRVADIRMPFDGFCIQFDEGQMVWPNGAVFEGAYVRATSDGISIAPYFSGPRGNRDETGFIFRVILKQSSEDKLKDALSRLRESISAVAASGSTIVEAVSNRALDGIEDRSARYDEVLALIGSTLCLLSAQPALSEIRTMPWPPAVQHRPGTAHKLPKGAVATRIITLETVGGETNGRTRLGISPRAHWRRGHWRRVLVGKGGDRNHVLRWIKPTLVNPAEGPMAEATLYRISDASNAPAPNTDNGGSHA